MKTKHLGKINEVYFGISPDYLDNMVLTLRFNFDGGMGVDYSWYDKNNSLLQFIKSKLKEAKISDLQDLVNIPVEIEIEDKLFRNFRILTEVL